MNFFRQSCIPAPFLSGRFATETIMVQGRKRTFCYYIQNHNSGFVNLMFAIHGAYDSGKQFRKRLGYEFDKYADGKNLIIIYPNGYRKTWNECRKHVNYPAKRKQIDDFRFFEEIMVFLIRNEGINIRRKFLFGFSNGGALVNRICLEYPEWVDAAAVIAANLPSGDNMDCIPRNRPVKMLHMSGTSDHINPFDGGIVNVLGLKKLGQVMSSGKTLEYWVERAGQNLKIKKTDLSKGIVKTVWNKHDKNFIVQYVIKGGGHSIPHPAIVFPGYLGPTNTEINAVQEICNFFIE